MKIIHINNIDLHGHRFNGHDLHQALIDKGYSSKHLVFDKFGELETTVELGSNMKKHYVRGIISNLEERLNLQSLLYPFGKDVMRNPDFLDCDLVHMHLFHNKFISMVDLIEISKRKKMVLTVHDPWVTTGHCIYPMDCNKWKTGCGNCENLELDFKMLEDNTRQMWDVKKEVFSQCDIDLIVASKYMEKIVLESPITNQIKNVHYVPFGIDLNVFKPKSNRDEIRSKLGIKKDDIVFLFRSINTPFKGLQNIIEAFDLLKKNHRNTNNVVILTCNDKGLIGKLEKNYRCIEFGWVYDDNQMSDLFNAADIFLMPSLAEAFGLMAIEAMACGTPVISFSGTSLEEVTFSPECGISVEMKSSYELMNSIKKLLENPKDIERRAELGLKLAKDHYNIDNYFNNMINCYKEIMSRK